MTKGERYCTLEEKREYERIIREPKERKKRNSPLYRNRHGIDS